MANYAVFDSAPVHEVAFSVQLTDRLVFKSFDAPSIHSAFSQKYPNVVEHSPLPPLTFPSTKAPLGSNIEFVSVEEPRARWWFISEDDDTLLQVQDDRFSRNWRKFGVDPVENYPGYSHLRDMFLNDFAAFSDVNRKQGFGDPQVLRCELTYINVIPMIGDHGETIRLKDMFSFINFPGSRKMNALQFVWFHDRQGDEVETERIYKADLSVGRIQDVAAANLTLVGLSNTDNISLKDTLDQMHDLMHKYFQELITDQLQTKWNKRVI